MKVLLTGGSRGIGAEILKSLERNGCEVVAPSRMELDLSSTDSIITFLRQLPSDFDALINNAGINVINDFHKTDITDFQVAMQVNCFAPIMISQYLIQHSFIPRNFGRILNIGTVWLRFMRKGRSSYIASKSALESVTRSMAVEYGSYNILSNMISPGIVDTDLTRQNNSELQIQNLINQVSTGKLIKPAEIAEWINFFILNNSTINGQNIFIDGGFKGSF
jgi:3-oxoacyl-[acyl-carrier protein] reductase